MSSGARLLVHEVTFYAEGAIEPDKLREFAEGLEIAHDDYAAIVSERTGLPLDRVEALMINHTYLDAQEALALGFATAITDQ